MAKVEIAERTATAELVVISERTSVATLYGEHDLFATKRLLETLACARQWPNVIVDLTPCEFLDTAIVNVLIAAHEAQMPGERFELVAPQNNGLVNRVLTLIGARGIIPTHETLAHAQLSVGEPPPFAADSPDNSVVPGHRESWDITA
jgi:anti-anti-sigma regulatory factor